MIVMRDRLRYLCNYTPYQKVCARSRRHLENNCITWAGHKDSYNYGMVRCKSKTIGAHRIVWEHYYGPIPHRMRVCHTFDNPPCCNIEHLFLGTDLDNMRDRDKKMRRAPPKGELNGQAKLHEIIVSFIRQSKRSCYLLARLCGVGKNAILRIKHSETWKHVINL